MMLMARYSIVSLTVSLLFLATISFFLLSSSPVTSYLPSFFPQQERQPYSGDTGSARDWTFQTDRDARNYALSTEQCSAAFPGLFDDIARSVQARQSNPITPQELDAAVKSIQSYHQYADGGWIRVLIYDSQLLVVDENKALVPTLDTRTISTLHALGRALQSDPEPHLMPNVEFLMGIRDFVHPDLQMFGYARQHRDQKTWLMPDFNYWSWPEPKVGSYPEVRHKIKRVEEAHPSFEHKIPQIFWRGNLDMAPELRGALLSATEGKEWADVRAIHWDDAADLKTNFVPIEDHCKYQFLAHTEGHSFSGRLKYIQHCRSIIFAHPFQWFQATDLVLRASGPDQNYVQVREDFSDLEEKLVYYLDHPEEATPILDNMAATFRDRYLTPAAESCYWRMLMRGYANASFEPELEKVGPDGKMQWRGVPLESVTIMRTLDWEAH